MSGMTICLTSLQRNLTLPGASPLYPDAHCTRTGEVCQLTTGEGEINADSSITALIYSDLFNLIFSLLGSTLCRHDRLCDLAPLCRTYNSTYSTNSTLNKCLQMILLAISPKIRSFRTKPLESTTPALAEYTAPKPL